MGFFQISVVLPNYTSTQRLIVRECKMVPVEWEQFNLCSAMGDWQHEKGELMYIFSDIFFSHFG